MISAPYEAARQRMDRRAMRARRVWMSLTVVCRQSRLTGSQPIIALSRGNEPLRITIQPRPHTASVPTLIPVSTPIDLLGLLRSPPEAAPMPSSNRCGHRPVPGPQTKRLQLRRRHKAPVVLSSRQPEVHNGADGFGTARLAAGAARDLERKWHGDASVRQRSFWPSYHAGTEPGAGACGAGHGYWPAVDACQGRQSLQLNPARNRLAVEKFVQLPVS